MEVAASSSASIHLLGNGSLGILCKDDALAVFACVSALVFGTELIVK